MSNTAGSKKTTKTSTFIIQIIYQRNGSWQGTIKWTNGRKEQYFRSELELLSLIDEAVNAGRMSAPSDGIDEDE